MSTCDITSGFTLGCRDNTGGLKNIYILSGSVDSTAGTPGLISELNEAIRNSANSTEADIAPF